MRGERMLEVKNLSKIYKSKKGADVRALDGVTIQFPEKGMVFLLGKSGSGKSTLLNVCGGLDAPTEGEILVKGRSSKDFSQSDFDSYRNTFVGFIFQEYNILNEFSVEDNIALALELQGKPKDKKAVAELLREVDLEGYAKRKPNTLSGGQKQRIAIARALVKSPEIIMADEPTGALDSNTGSQVFETLKKLSKDKLVLVVSHDREFAEQYGDRIIELQDGKVLSDVSKTMQQQEDISDNIKAVGDVLCIKQGSQLDENDFEKIKNFLKKTDGDVIIANNETDVKNFKKASRISDDGEKEVFCDTDIEGLDMKEYRPEDSKFIRSKLPARHAIRMGLSGLMKKPIRLTFTILLCTVAFIFFGLLSTMSFYDSESTFKQTMLDSTRDLLRLEKQFRATENVYQNGEQTYDYEVFYETRFTKEEVEKYQKQFGKDVFGALPIDYSFATRSNNVPYWISAITLAAVLPEDNSLREKIQGTYPSAKNEICISSYTADVIVNCKTYDDSGNTIDVQTTDALIGKTIMLAGKAYKITGIFDSGAIPEKYESLKSAEEEKDQLAYQLQSELSDGLFFAVFVTPDVIEEMAKMNQPYMGEKLIWYRNIVMSYKNKSGKYEFPEFGNGRYGTLDDLEGNEIIAYLNGDKKELSDREMVLTRQTFCEYVSRVYDEKIETYYEQENYTKADRLSASRELCSQIWNGGIWKRNNETKKDELILFTQAEMLQKISQLSAAMKRDGIKVAVGAKMFNDYTSSAFGDLKEFEVVGLILNEYEEGSGKVLVSNQLMKAWWEEQRVAIDYYSEITTKYKADKDAIYGNIFLPYDHSHEQTDVFWDMYNNKQYAEDDSRAKPTGMYIEQLAMIDEMVHSLSKVFLYVGLALAAFAAILLSNFISVSISQKKKEIGILRAVGARSFDVFKIFFSESFFIGSVCVALASVASAVICNFLNQEFAADLGASLFVFGFLSLIVLIAIAFVTTVIATFLPVWNAAKKKPVESIRSL